MNGEALLAALDLPADTRIDLRVPKTLLLEHGSPTAADKRRIREGIDQLAWVAALKPMTVGIPEYGDSVREYLEIAVLRLTLRTGSGAPRLVELVHRSVPYPLLLVAETPLGAGLSAVHKRWAQNEAARVVLDGDVVSAEYDTGDGDRHWPAFRDRLALGRQPRDSLHALYQGWIDTLRALEAARVTGKFRDAVSPSHAAERQEALGEVARLDREIARLRAVAAKERQVARQVELNLEIKELRRQLSEARRRL